METLIVVRRSTVCSSILASATIGLILGILAVAYLWRTAHWQIDVPTEAMRQARAIVEDEMRAACANWFTDKRVKGLPPGRIVVCKAPEFLSKPIQ